MLSVEIGFGVPAAFVYDAHEGVRMIAGTAAAALGEAEAGDGTGDGTGDGGAVRVRVEDPREVDARGCSRRRGGCARPGHGAAKPAAQTEVFEGADAYCVQAPRHAVARRCWEALD